MSKRTTRVNELLKREISTLLHTDWRAETVTITITGVEVSPDLRNARVFFSVFGDDDARQVAERFLIRNRGEIRRKVGNSVILKYLPELRFHYDDSIQRGTSVLEILEELDENDDNNP